MDPENRSDEGDVIPKLERGAGGVEPARTAKAELRHRHYFYRTEKSDLFWIERFARHLGTHNLEAAAEHDLAAFLDARSVDQHLGASSQRKALNALVFLYREVFKRQLGDFSEYRRARARAITPVWQTREEMHLRLGCLNGPWNPRGSDGNNCAAVAVERLVL